METLLLSGDTTIRTQCVQHVLGVFKYHTDDLDVMKDAFLTMRMIGVDTENMRYFFKVGTNTLVFWRA